MKEWRSLIKPNGLLLGDFSPRGVSLVFLLEALKAINLKNQNRFLYKSFHYRRCGPSAGQRDLQILQSTVRTSNDLNQISFTTSKLLEVTWKDRRYGAAPFLHNTVQYIYRIRYTYIMRDILQVWSLNIRPTGRGAKTVRCRLVAICCFRCDVIWSEPLEPPEQKHLLPSDKL